MSTTVFTRSHDVTCRQFSRGHMTSLTDGLHAVDIDARHANGLVVGAGGDDVTRRIPRGAVDRAFVVLVLRQQHLRRLGDVILPVT